MEKYPNEFELDEAAQADYNLVLEAHIACLGLTNCAGELEDSSETRPVSERQSAQVVANAVKFSDLSLERIESSLAKALIFQPEHLRDEVLHNDLDYDELETTVLSLIFHKNGTTSQFLAEGLPQTRGHLDADQMERVIHARKMIVDAELDAQRSNPTRGRRVMLLETASQILESLGRPTMTLSDEEVVLRSSQNNPRVN